jgi:hypothetical protein
MKFSGALLGGFQKGYTKGARAPAVEPLQSSPSLSFCFFMSDKSSRSHFFGNFQFFTEGFFMTKKQLLLVWIAKFGFSTSTILEVVLGTENKRVRNLIYELSQRSKAKKQPKTAESEAKSKPEKQRIPTIPLLKRVEVSGLQGQVLYMLTEAGLAEASRANPQDYRYSHKPSEMINFDLLLHSLGVQFIVGRLFAKSEERDISGIVPERFMNISTSEKRPDALIFRNGKWTAIEYERSEKSGDRLDRFFQEIEAALLAKKNDEFIIFTDVDGVSQRYKNHAKSPFQRWKMNPRTKRWESFGKKPLADEVRGKIFIQTLQEIRKATHPISYGIAKKESKK